MQMLPGTGPAEDDLYEIYQLTYAHDPGRRVHDNFILRDMHDGPMPVDFNLWILRNAHRIILVDTGFSPRAAAERKRPLDIDPVEALARIGVDPDTVEDVVITHLHFDHAGNLDRFGKARFHIQDAEVAFATGRCMCDAFIRRPFDVEDVVTLVRHTYANILNMKPFNLTVDVPATLDTYRRAMALAGAPHRFIPGHDPKARRLFPTIEVNGIALLALHEEPAAHQTSDLMRTDNF